MSKINAVKYNPHEDIHDNFAVTFYVTERFITLFTKQQNWTQFRVVS
jgi:hypothetical protein